MAKLLPVLVIVVCICAGAGAGWLLRPIPEPTSADEVTEGDADGEAYAASDEAGRDDEPSGELEYVKLNNQFVVPVVHDGRVTSLVVMSLSLEVQAGGREVVYTREPKIRDALLSVLFQHANAGGFDGAFTATRNMDILKDALTDATRLAMESDLVANVLVIDIVRQDLE